MSAAGLGELLPRPPLPAAPTRSDPAPTTGEALPKGAAPSDGQASDGIRRQVCRRLEFQEPSQAAALHAARALLRYPPIQVEEGSPVGPWLREVAELVDVA